MLSFHPKRSSITAELTCYPSNTCFNSCYSNNYFSQKKILVVKQAGFEPAIFMCEPSNTTTELTCLPHVNCKIILLLQLFTSKIWINYDERKSEDQLGFNMLYPVVRSLVTLPLN